jgi:hypothetical protein
MDVKVKFVTFGSFEKKNRCNQLLDNKIIEPLPFIAMQNK